MGVIESTGAIYVAKAVFDVRGKAHWHKVALAKEQHDLPDHDIEVTVLDETDDEGNPLWTVQKKKVIVVSKDWEPNR